MKAHFSASVWADTNTEMQKISSDLGMQSSQAQGGE